MRPVFLFFALVLITNFTSAQTKEYQMTPEYTARAIQKYPDLLHLSDASNQTIDVPKYDTLYVQRGEYTSLLTNIESLKKDSISEAQKNEKALNDYNEVNSIIAEIDSFIKSDSKFKDKKEHLLKAQKIDQARGFSHLIYADNTINQSKIADYMSLKLDKVALENHLIQIKIDLQNRNPKPVQYNRYSSKLNDLRIQLSKTPKNEINLTQNGSYKANGIILGNEIEDLTTITGTFKYKGEYYIINDYCNGYVPNQLVEKEIIDKNKLSNCVKYRASSLIEEVNTGKMYYGTENFLYYCGNDMTTVNFAKKLNSLGYKTTLEGEDYFITTQYGKLALTSDIYENVNNGNVSYINELAQSVRNFNALVNQSVPITTNLLNHFNAYQHATLTVERLNIWKAEVTKGQNIYDKMQALKGRDMDNLYNYQKHLSTETLDKFNNFWQVLSGSKPILGM